jgi:chromosome segregation ATPase
MENINKAAVEVHFKKVLEQSDGLIKDVPYSNFSIRRVVNSSSGSKYFIDRNESTQS